MQKLNSFKLQLYAFFAMGCGMRRHETIALFSQGRDAWNAWAHKKLAELRALQESGLWTLEGGDLEPTNEEARAWIEAVEVDFSSCQFLVKGSEKAEEVTDWVEIVGKKVDLSGFIFPGAASFEGAIFSGETRFVGASFRNYVSFKNAKFAQEAIFTRAVFSGGASFLATFSGDTWFNEAKFSAETLFGPPVWILGVHSAAFSGYAWFSRADFSGDALFGGVVFGKEVYFSSGIFSGDARFDRAVFSGEAYFNDANFTKSTSFRGAKFGTKRATDANFTAIKVERAFDLTGAYFSKVPNFCQADFKQAPDLDRVYFPPADIEPLAIGDENLIPKYRALRRMAIQGADYEREQRAFRGELRSRRRVEDKRRHPSLWLGILYDLASDCGRSVGRPFALWLTSIFVFAVLYIPSSKHGWDACLSGDDSLFWNSFYISGRNAWVISTAGKSESTVQAYQCLFGAKAPPLGMSIIETFLQAPLSAVLIFLFLLAVKNRFKIK